MINKTLQFEIQRKIFHLCSLIYPFVYIFVSKMTMGISLSIITFITLCLDILRHYYPQIQFFVDSMLGKFQRQEEKSGAFVLSGVSYMVLGFLVTCLFFTKVLTIISWLVFIISDCCAAIIGMKYGTPLLNGKSYIGSAAFFCSSILISIILHSITGDSYSLLTILVSCLCCTCIEFLSKQIRINDNFTIPLTYTLSIFILDLI